MAAALVERVLGESAEVLDRFPGSALAGSRYEPPFDYITDYGPRGHTVLEADFVTTNEGTGLVHTAIAFGEDDFALGEQYGIKLQNPVKPDGTFDERITDFAGRFVKDADTDIVDALRERGRLLRAETYEHSYPHCWRCDTPLLYYAKSSWYIRTTEVRDRMLAENETIGWHPEHIKHGRFGKWLEGNVDWALSRERYWGTPLPIWECEAAECEERFCAGSLADLRERGGDVPEDVHRPFIDEVVLRCESCGGQMRRVAEVIDAWYDSGSMPFAQFHYPFEGVELFTERFPANFISEAIDQTRGWFYSLLAISTLVFDRTSYQNCVCLGLILDAEGQKMSKSRGNVVDPWEVITSHGADAFRWYLFTAQQPWAVYRFSTDTVGETVYRFFTTLWNTYRICALYASAEGLGPADLAGAGSLAQADLDRWAISRLQATTTDRYRPDGRLRLHERRGRDRGLRRGAVELVRAPLPAPPMGGRHRGARDAASMPAPGRGAAGAVHALPRGGDLRQPGRWRSPATSASCPTRSTSGTSPSPTIRLPMRSSSGAWRRSGARSSSAGRRAPSRGSRRGSRCAARLWSRAGPSGRRSPSAPTS